MIRRAGPDDVGTVARIHVASWQVADRGIMPDDVIVRTDVAYRTTFWRARIVDHEGPVFLLEAEGRPVAFCQMIATKDADDDPKRVGHITSLHVLPDVRGSGYGRRLLEHALREFRRRGFTEVTLWVLEENRKARAFYERMGFMADGGRKSYPGTTVPEVRYRAHIATLAGY